MDHHFWRAVILLVLMIYMVIMEGTGADSKTQEKFWIMLAIVLFLVLEPIVKKVRENKKNKDQ